MRRTLLILGTLIILGALFALYLYNQPPSIRLTPGQQLSQGRNPTTAEAGGSIGAIGPGQGVWVSEYASDGRLTSRFRASEFLPKADNTVKAVYPEAEIMLSNGGKIHLVATSGTVSVRTSPARAGTPNPMGGSTPQMPSRGHMQDVLVHVENDQGVRMLTMKVNNVAFDLDTFRIYTEAYTDPAGVTVAADRVKVEVRGDDVDFDGYGLTMRWDDQGGIIQSLEVAHGERIVIKKAPKSLAMDDRHDPVTATPAPLLYRPLELAAADPLDPSTIAAATSKPTTAAKRLIPYRAKLLKDVRIVQGDQTLGTGDTLTIDFLNEANGEKKKDHVATPAATQPVATVTSIPTTTAPAELPAPTPVPTSLPVVATSPVPTTTTTAPASAPVAAAAAQEDQPITVYWTGPLRMVPLEKTDKPLGELSAGNAIAELSGEKVSLQQAGATVAAGSALYRTLDGGAALRPAAGQSVVTITDADGRTLTTNAIDFDGNKKVATLLGAGKLNAPATPETDDQPLDATWTKGATIHLAGDGKTQSLDRIECVGDVSVNHPQLTLSSQNLGLHFAPGTDAKKPILRQVTASDRVKVVTIDEKEGSRTIETDALALDMTADTKGNPSPSRFTATGRVRAYDDEQQLEGDKLMATLGPGEKEKSPELKDLTVDGHVKITGKDDATATADRLKVTTIGKQHRIELSGRNGASVASVDGNVQGQSIVVTPETGVARVVGKGSLQTVQGKGDETRPVKVTWTGGATLDSKKNLVEVTGDNVMVESQSADGKTTETSKSKRVLIRLADREGASDKAKDAKKPKKTDSPLGGVSANAFGDKEPVEIILMGSAEVGSVEQMNGQFARRSSLLTEEVRYDLKTETVFVPGAGRALYEDVRPEGVKDDGARGQTAVEWKQSMKVDGRTNKATMDGAVVIRHLPLAADALPLQVNADGIEADLVRVAKGATTTGPASQPTLGVRRVVTKGRVTFKSGDDTEFSGTSLTYDAETGIVVATGTDGDLLQVRQPGIIGEASEMRYNLKAGKIESIKNLIVKARR